MSIGKRLKEYLTERNLTQEELSVLSKVNKQTISNIVKDKTAPSGDVLTKIAAQYADLNLNWLITGYGSMFNDENESSARRLLENAQDKDSLIRGLLKEKDNIIDTQKVTIEALKETLKSQRELIDQLKDSSSYINNKQ